jgi:hypothetical protein
MRIHVYFADFPKNLCMHMKYVSNDINLFVLLFSSKLCSFQLNATYIFFLSLNV